MKKNALIILLLFPAIAAWAQQLDRRIKPKPGPAPVITIGATDSFSLPNGLRVFVVENHKLPTIACNIELDIKPELEGDMAGYRSMMADLLLSGTTTRTKDKLNEEIDEMGARFSVSDEGIAVSGLKKHELKIFELMADIAMNAVIKQDELDKRKEKAISEIESRKDDPDQMVSNVSAVVNFGKKHPYGEIPTDETIKNINLDRCNGYYNTYFRPNVAYMAVVGDVTMKEIRPLIEKYFGAWQKKDVPETTYEIAGLPDERATEVYFVPREAAVQSAVSITYPVDLKPASQYAIIAQIANTVLGGGSQGRLFQDLREKHGWTYGAYSSLEPDELGAVFSADVNCRNDVTDSAIQAILDEMRLMQEVNISDTAMQNAINYLSGSFAIGLENPATVAQYAINIVRYQLPQDYYKNYLTTLQEIDPGTLLEMARRFFMPGHANIVVAGSKDDVADKLARFSADGKLHYCDYAGNTIKPEEAVAAPPGLTTADVLRNYIKAIGGESAIIGIKDIKIVGTSTMQGSEFTITELKKAPDKWQKYVEMNKNDMKLPVQKMTYNGSKGYQEARGKKVALTGESLAEIAEQADMYACLHPEKYGISRALKGMENLNGNSVYVIQAVNGKGIKSTEYYDAHNWLLVKAVRERKGVAQVSEYGDYREAPGSGGYKLPYLITEKNGNQVITETVKTVEVNKGIPDSFFN